MVDESALPYRGDEINGIEPRCRPGYAASCVTSFMILSSGQPTSSSSLPPRSAWHDLARHKDARLTWPEDAARGGRPVRRGRVDGVPLPDIASWIAWSAWKWTRTFRHGLLIPGVVVSGFVDEW